jgi:hypothetical protein
MENEEERTDTKNWILWAVIGGLLGVAWFMWAVVLFG